MTDKTEREVEVVARVFDPEIFTREYIKCGHAECRKRRAAAKDRARAAIEALDKERGK